MKRLLLLLSVLGSLVVGALPASATMEVGVGVSIHATSDFYAPLAANGAWVEVGSYGRCWHPAHVAADWRPYCDGYWEWTDCGWYWVSEEPWAWACYHYGRWVMEPSYGWIWTPDVEWAPAWVYWRVGGAHVGWAPCPPRGRAVVDAQFVFVDTVHFHDRVRPSAVIINNPTIIHETKLITKTSRATRTIEGVGRERVVINNGPGVDRIQKATGKKFAAVSIHTAAARTPMPERRIEKVITHDPGVKSGPAEQGRPSERQPDRAPEQHVVPNPGPGPQRPPEHVEPRPSPGPDQVHPPEHVEPRPAEPPHDDRGGDGRDGGDRGGGHEGGGGHGHDKDGH